LKLRRPLKIVAKLLAILLLLVLLLLFVLQLPATQRWLTPKLENWLAEKLKTEVTIESVGIRFPKALEIKGFNVKTPEGDSLLSVGSLLVDLEMWGLFNSDITIQKIALKNASVNLRQEAGRSNFAFILEAFATPTEAELPPTPADTSGGFRLVMKPFVVDFEAVAFSWQDFDGQQFIKARLGKMLIEAEKADFKNTLFSVEKLTISDADISYRDLGPPPPDTSGAATLFDVLVKNGDINNSRIFYETDSLALTTRLNETVLEDFRLLSNAAGLSVSAKALELADSDIAFRQKSTPQTPGKFNAADLDLKGLQADLTDFTYQNQALNVNVAELTGKDKSGLDLRKLEGKIAYSPAALSLQDIDLAANTTKLEGSVELKFGAEGQAPITNFSANLREAGGQIGDLLQFLPDGPAMADLKKMANNSWSASGKVEGTMDQINAQNLQVAFGKNTRLSSSGRISNIRSLDRLEADLRLTDFYFDKADLAFYLKGKNLPLPAFAKASGTVRGRSGLLNINLIGSFGSIDTLVVAPANPDVARFNLSGELKGLANPKTMQMDLDIQQFEASGSNFAGFVPKDMTLPDSISLTGKLKGGMNDLFADLKLGAQRKGAASNLAVLGNFQHLDKPDSLRFDLSFSGKVAKQEIFGYVADSLVTPYLELPSVVALEGKAKGRVQNLTAALTLGLGEQGTLALDGYRNGEKYGANIEGKQLKVSELAADSLLPQLRLLNISAQLEGQGFDIGKTATVTLTSKIPTLIWEEMTFENTVLNGNLTGKKFDVRLTSPDRRVHLDLTANGDLGGEKPKLEWNALFDCVDLKAFNISEKNATACFRLRGNADGLSMDTLDALVFLEDMQLQVDSLKLHPGDVKFAASMHQGKNDLAITSDWLNAWVRGKFNPANLPHLANDFFQHYFEMNPVVHSTNTQHQAPITDTLAFGLALAHPDLFTSGILPGLSQLDTIAVSGNFDAASFRFVFDTKLPRSNYNEWNMKDLSFHADGNGKTAAFKLKIPSVKQYGEAFVRDLSLDGTLDGNRAVAQLTALDSTGKERYRLGLFAETNDFREGYTAHFSPKQLIDYQDWSLPEANSVNYTSKAVTVKNFHLTNGEQALRLDGTSTVLADGNRTLGFKVEMDRLGIATFGALLASSLKNPSGWLDGKLEIGGTVAAPKPSGSLSLNQVKATLAMTNVRYALSDKKLEFAPDGIDLSGLTLTDPQGNSLNIKGKLKTTDWSGLRYDLEVSARNWLVMDTKKSQNVAYYGKLVANANGTVRGPISEPDISLTISPVKGSMMHYLHDDAQNKAEGNGVVVFVKPAGAAQTERKILSKKYPFHLNLNLDLNDDLELDIIADPVSGDNFEGTLEGRLSLEIFPDGKMNLAGRCEVKRGNYRYTYQQIVKRRFEVAPGSNLAWSGDPFKPDLQITARYVVRTSPHPLLLNWGADIEKLNSPEGRDFQTFFLNFKVTGDLLRPQLTIDLEYPDTDSETFTGTGIQGNSGSTDIAAAITSLNQDQAQLSQQVFSLLIFNRFSGDTRGAGAASQDAITAGLNSFLTSQFNTLADQYLRFVDVQLETKEDATFGDNDEYTGTTNYNLRLQKSFFNDRLVFKLSGGAAEDRGSESEWRGTFENASVEYSLTPSGIFKVRAFSEDGLRLLDANGARNSGAGVLFTKEFKRVFRRKKK